MLYMFDFDGTIVDNRGIGRRSILSMLKKYNIKHDEDEVINRVYNSFEDMIESMKSDFFEERDFQDFFDEYNETCITFYVKLQPKRMFLEYLETLKNDKVIIATRNSKKTILSWLKVMNLDLEVVAEHEVNVRKDEKEFYNLMSNKYNVSISDMVIFEDNTKNIVMANECGVKVVGVTNYHNDENLEIIKNNAVVVIDDYEILIKEKLV